VFAHNGHIVTRNLTTGAQRVLGQGGYPFWGTAGGPAPAISLSLVPGQGLQWAALHRRLSVFCRLTGAGRCAVTASISPFSARRLHLSVKRGARAYVLGRGSARLRGAGRATVTIGLSAGTASALGRVRQLAVTLSARATAPGTKATTRVVRVTLRR
jgi:hypothetical protein